MCHGLAARVHARHRRHRRRATTGLTTARPPFQPVTLAALAGPHLAPVRRTAMHERHDGARRDAGWTWATGSGRSTTATSRPSAGRSTRRPGSSTSARSASSTSRARTPARSSTGSTRTGSATCKVGRVRYRAMLDDAGIILDDGTVARLGAGAILRLDHDRQPRRRRPVAALVARRRRPRDVARDRRDLPVRRGQPRRARDAREILARLTDARRLARGDALPRGRRGRGRRHPGDHPAHRLRGRARLRDPRPGRLRRAPLGRAPGRRARTSGCGRSASRRSASCGSRSSTRSSARTPTRCRTRSRPGMGWLVKADKPDFIGRDAVARPSTARGRAPGPDRASRSSGRTCRPRAPRSSATAQPIGRVTSAKWSPTLDRADRPRLAGRGRRRRGRRRSRSGSASARPARRPSGRVRHEALLRPRRRAAADVMTRSDPPPAASGAARSRRVHAALAGAAAAAGQALADVLRRPGTASASPCRPAVGLAEPGLYDKLASSGTAGAGRACGRWDSRASPDRSHRRRPAASTSGRSPPTRSCLVAYAPTPGGPPVAALDFAARRPQLRAAGAAVDRRQLRLERPAPRRAGVRRAARGARARSTCRAGALADLADRPGRRWPACRVDPRAAATPRRSRASRCSSRATTPSTSGTSLARARRRRHRAARPSAPRPLAADAAHGGDSMIGPLRRIRVGRPRPLKSSLRRRHHRRRRPRPGHRLRAGASAASRTSPCSSARYLGSGASGRNTAIIRSNYRTAAGRRLLRRVGEALRAAVGGARLQRPVHPARPPDASPTPSSAIAGLRVRAETNQLLGRRQSRVIDPDEIRKLAPALDLSTEPRFPILAALYHPPGGIIRHDAVVWGYARRAERAGRRHPPVHRGHRHRRRRRPRHRRPDDRAARSGPAPSSTPPPAGRRRSPQMVGLRLPIVTHPLQALVTEPLKPFLDPVLVSATLHVYVSQTDRGELVIGSEIDPYASYSSRSTLPFLESSARTRPGAAAVRSPGVKVLRQWAGICDMTPDYSPIMGPVPERRRLHPRRRLGHLRLQGRARRPASASPS